MSKIAIIGATGRAGSQLLDEALRRGHSVTGIARGAAALAPEPRLRAQAVDLLDNDALTAALAGHDVVISAARFDGVPPLAIIGAVQAAQVPRLLVVGGAASLLLPDGTRLFDSPSFPEAYRAEAAGGIAFLDALRALPALDWGFLSPSALFDGNERTGTFRLGQDHLLMDAAGQSRISFPDFATALIDELERPAHSRQRFTVGY
ncbi:MAG: 3-beta hydroxysteroid dehydrogenase [Burkholderiales bacterium PBB5]|nr:MAG: 3-beta hydroxysteroid dehydrogenase [Burkholderiales bacterium PBB5]